MFAFGDGDEDVDIISLFSLNLEGTTNDGHTPPRAHILTHSSSQNFQIQFILLIHPWGVISRVVCRVGFRVVTSRSHPLN